MINVAFFFNLHIIDDDLRISLYSMEWGLNMYCTRIDICIEAVKLYYKVLSIFHLP